MIRVLVFFAVLLALAFGVVWLADHPGTVTVAFGGQVVQTSTLVALAALLAAAVVVAIAWAFLSFLFRIPSVMTLASRNRRKQRGFDALSHGLLAVGSGDREGAQRYARDAHRYFKHEPLTLLLRAQTAQMTGDREAAEKTFAEMLGHRETRALGLRGLHVEAQRRGDAEAALSFADEALKTGTLPWAGQAVLQYRAQQRDWAGAMKTVERNAGGRSIDRATAARQKAVLGTAMALDIADREPDEALSLAREALRAEPTLVPAAGLAGKLLARKGDIRRAAKLLETAYAATPHPELAAAYLGIRPGDSAADRLERARKLARLAPSHPESRLAVAGAALEARDFKEAREVMESLVAATADERPTVNACLMMAEIEEAEHGETGALFEWLQRASRGRRDPAWVADGVVSDHWEPVSPVTGKLDAFEWTTPKEQLSAPIELKALRRRNEEANALVVPASAEGDGSTVPSTPVASVSGTSAGRQVEAIDSVS